MSVPTPPVTPQQRLYRIVEDGMCIGCGLCQSVAGPHRVRVVKVKSGYERPVVVGTLDHETVDRIYDVCPGTHLEGLPEELVDDESLIDLVWGPYRRIVRAHATDPKVRFQGSTGGVLTALGQYLVTSGEVDFILHAKASRKHPTFGERHISFDPADVLAGAGSRYGPTAPLIDVRKVLDRNRPFAFIGKPCDVAALRNYAHHDARVDVLVKHWLTPVCGGFMPPDEMDRFLREREGVDPAEVTEFRYRGHGCPGKTRFVLADGTATELRYTQLWGTDASQWTLPFRCKVCPDGIGEAADIAAADTWPGGSPDPETEDQDPGTNAVLVRNAAGAALMAAAEAAGFVTIEEELDPRYMDSAQPHQMRKKFVVRARLDGLAAEGRTVPRCARLRLYALSAEMGATVYRTQLEGTRHRVRTGKADETTPELDP
jgi:coenzyme F420 hydrogenase subunit beta